jgi:hypothetical protein
MASKQDIQAAKELAKYQEERQKALNKEKDLIKDQTDLSKMLLASVKSVNIEGAGGLKVQEDLAAALADRVSAADALKVVDAGITELLEKQAKFGFDIDKDLLSQLESTRATLVQMDEIAKAEGYRKELLDDRKKTLHNILGLDDDIAKAVASGAVAALAMNKAFENVGASLTAHVDTMRDMVTQQGLSVGESVILKGNIDAASFSLTGMLYGSDALASSASAIAEKFGNVNAATSDMIKGVTEVASLTGDAASATDLVTTFQNAGMEAGEVGDHIKELAEKHGVNAKKMMEGMGSQMSKLRGKTQEQLDVILEGNAALIKQGTNMEEIQNIANNVLDIEGNMKAAAKARVMLGRDVNSNAVRSAALSLESARTDKERAIAQERLSAEILKGVGGQEEFAQMTEKEKAATAAAMGMDKEQLSVMMDKKRVQDELTAKYGEAAPYIEMASGAFFSAAKGAGGLLLEMGKVIAKTAIMNLMMNGKTGIGGMFTGAAKSAKDLASKIKGGKPDLPGLDKTKDIGPKVDKGGSKSGGGLKSLADGLKEMGDGKVFAGIGAVALAGPAFIIALPSIPFLLFMGLTPLKQLETNFSGLATGLNSMASTFMGSLAVAAFGIAAIPSIASIPFLLFMGLTPLAQLGPNFTSLSVGLTAMASSFMGSLALGAFAVAAGLAIASIPFLIAISLLGIPASAGLGALGVGLTALGTAAASGLPFLGIALIGALGLAMIPFAIALNIATPAIEAFGGVIVGVMGAIPPIIGAIADGFVTMMGALSLENIGALMLLGPALMLASVGMVAFGISMAVASAASFFGGGIIDDITELAMIGPQLATAGDGLASITTNLGATGAVIETLAESLSTMGSVTAPLYGVAGGLFSIAGGLVSMAGAGLLALPIFAAIGGLAAIAPVLDGLGSLFGGGGDEESSDSGDSDMIDYERLASVLQSQPIVLSIDGKAVQKITAVQRRQGKNARGFS